MLFVDANHGFGKMEVLNFSPGLVQKSTEPTGPGRNLLTQEDDRRGSRWFFKQLRQVQTFLEEPRESAKRCGQLSTSLKKGNLSSLV